MWCISFAEMADAPGAASVNLSQTAAFAQAQLKRAQQKHAESPETSVQQHLESEDQNEAHRSAVDVSHLCNFLYQAD